MSSFLVCYATSEGQTEKVADRITDRLAERGHDATARRADELPTEFDLTDFDAVLVGASVHVGKHQSEIRDFVTHHGDALATRPTAFFQLSMSSATDDETRRAQAADYVDSFLEATDWHPDRIGLFGGALRYSKYGFLKRLLMKRVAKDATGDVDASRDYEYTDWHEVEAFTDDFAAFAENRLADRPPETT